MRYLLVISSLTAGGAERVLTHLANRWAEQGHDVTIIPFKNIPSFYPLNKRIQCVWLPESPTLWLKWLFFFMKIIAFRYHVHRLKPERVLSFLDKTNLVTLFMLWHQGFTITVSERIDPRRYYIHPIWQWLRHKLYPTANHVVVQTSDIASYFPYPTHIIPNPVIPTEHCLEAKTKATRLITFGRLDPQKDHLTLLQAMNILVKRHPHLQLSIYGEGAERKRLEKAVHEMNLSKNVELPGLTTSVSEKLLQSDIFVFPSLYEGFPNALCEAMSHGIPVVASHIPGNTDIVEDGVNGYLFPVGRANVLANILDKMIDDPNLRKNFGRAAKETMQLYTPERIGAAWDEVMK